MTQPPGPYGDAYGRPEGPPGPYGPPPPHGQPGPYGPAPYGPTPYGPPGPYPQAGPYGLPPQPPRPPGKNLLPWLIVGGAVLLSGLGIMLVLLLSGGDEPADRSAASESSSAPATSASASPSREPALGSLPGGAQVAEPTAAAVGQFEGSDGVAFAWVEAMAAGDWQTAYDLSCAEVQDAATTAAAGGDPGYELGRYFYEQTLGGVGFSEGTFDSISYDATTNTDLGVFTLAMENGESFTLLVYVGEDLTVCDFL